MIPEEKKTDHSLDLIDFQASLELRKASWDGVSVTFNCGRMSFNVSSIPSILQLTRLSNSGSLDCAPRHPTHVPHVHFSRTEP